MHEFKTQMKFGAVILNQVIEHVSNPRLVIRNIKDHLKTDGIIFIETPSWEGVDASLFSSRYWGGYHFPRHFVIYSKSSLCTLLRSEGLEILSTTYLASPTFWIQSCHHFLLEAGWGKLSGFFTNKNPLLLAIFTAIDLVSILIGKPTSNMRIIAVKKGE